MTWLSPWVAVPGLALLLCRIGWHLVDRRAPGEPRGPGDRLALSFLAGAVLLHLTLLLLDLVGIPWAPVLLLLALILLLFLPRLLPRGPFAPRHRPLLALGWGDAVAGLACLTFALLAATQWITLPDFIYHWGLKAERFALHRGIDWTFLERAWNSPLHPDYPNLLPNLYAASALLSRFSPAAQTLWSVLFLFLLLATARDTLRNILDETGLDRWTHQAALALLALTALTFAIGYQLPGGGDLAIALALLVAAPALLGPPSPTADLRVGLAAAFAAGTKIEGVPLAAFLLLLHLLRRLRQDGRAAWTSLLAALPPTALILPWLLQNHRHHLFQAANTGPFDWHRAPAIAAAIREAAAAPELHGLPYLAALLPLLYLAKRTRPLALLLTLQSLFYLWTYLASTLDPHLYVVSNFDRLLFQLLPTILLGAVIAITPRAAPGVGPSP